MNQLSKYIKVNVRLSRYVINNVIQKRTFISLDPLVNWVADIQKRKFVKTVLPINIYNAFKKERKIKEEVRLENDSVEELKEELKSKVLIKDGIIKHSSWICYFASARCGLSSNLDRILLDVKGASIVCLSQQTFGENFNVFVVKQLQGTQLTKLEDILPGDLRDALKDAIDKLIKEDIKPVLFIDDGEFALKDNELKPEFKKFLEMILEFSNKISLYIITHDIRVIKSLKQISEIREHLEFRSWNYSNFQQVEEYLKKLPLNLSNDQIKETTIKLMGHEGDVSDYVSGLLNDSTHEVELYKLIIRGYLQLRECIINPPPQYQELKDKSKFRIIAFCTFFSIYKHFKEANKQEVEFTFPINEKVMIKVSELLSLIKKVSSEISLDEVLSGLEIMMTNVYGVIQEVNLNFDINKPWHGDIFITWSGGKYQYSMEKCFEDKIINELMKEVNIDIRQWLKENHINIK